jgi:acetolactate decarboxylase
MLKSRWIPLVVLTLIVVVSCATLYIVLQSQSGSRETVFQVAAFKPFAEGEYASITTFDELAKHGDFGLGTLDGLDGEMVAINGVFYQIPISGTPRKIASTEETPFALVTFFEADQTLHVADAMNYSELKTYIDQNISPENAMYAIRIHGTYDYAEVRSVPKQTEPYPNLTAVIENQVIFPLSDVTGTIAGFRLPSYMNEINVAGYHCHFITDDETAGGHVLDCVVRDVIIEIDYTYDYELVLPETL